MPTIAPTYVRLGFGDRRVNLDADVPTCPACAHLHRCSCECGCSAHSHYRRCDPCGRGIHAGPPAEPVMPVAIRGALAFGDFAGKPTRLKLLWDLERIARKAGRE